MPRLSRTSLSRLFLLTLMLFCITVEVKGYSTGQYIWGNPLHLYYSDPNIDSVLNVTGSRFAIQNAANTWSQMSAFQLLEQDPSLYDINKHTTLGTADFRLQNECGPVYGPVDLSNTVWASTCPVPQNSLYRYNRIVFNSSTQNPKYIWNTQGDHRVASDGRYSDVQTVALHEFGHIVGLNDLPSAPSYVIMNYQGNGARYALSEDDKRGAVQIYGVYTGFDGGRADGIQYASANDHSVYSTYKMNVVNWFNAANTVPLMVHSSRELVNGVWVNPFYGDRMMRLEGSSTAGLSYVYFKLFSVKDDLGSDTPSIIPSNSRLKWCQYNFQQSTFSIDATFSDGTSMRDYGNVRDQNGIQVGPANRGVYPTGGWYCFDADLSSVAGKRVLHWYLSYDNRNTNIGGQFRAYFDSIRLVVPGGKQ